MEHFSENRWADFVRGLRVSEEAQGIKAHIAAGCISCKTARHFLDRVHAMALAEQAYAAPENLVRLAKLEFTAKQSVQAEKWTVATLLFDSFSRPLAAGVRSSSAVARQLVFEAEGLTVDLRFDPVGNSGKVSAVGQILDKQTPGQSVAGAPVVVWTESGQLVGTTNANFHGEFQLEFVVQNDLRLTARVGRRRLRMPLTNLK